MSGRAGWFSRRSAISRVALPGSLSSACQLAGASLNAVGCGWSVPLSGVLEPLFAPASTVPSVGGNGVTAVGSGSGVAAGGGGGGSPSARVDRRGRRALLRSVMPRLSGGTHPACVIAAAARLRKGSTNSARGAARFVTDALITARKAGASGIRVLRADSAYYNRDVIAAVVRQGACFSITARQDKALRRAIATIGEHAWTPIDYTIAVFDEPSQSWISDA